MSMYQPAGRIGFLIAFACASSFGQTTLATITGAIKDPASAPVPNITVEATQTGTNYRYTSVSNEAGVYTLAQLREGTYVIRVRAPGFKEFVADGIQLVALDVRRIDVALQLGDVGSKVEVTSGATLIETETARISDTKEASLLGALPLNTRSMSTFLNTVPTVNPMVGTSRARFAGSRAGQENYAIDGISANSHQANSMAAMFGFMESFQEARIDATNNTAEFGTIGQYSMISKSGTNQVHGSAFDYYASNSLNARNPFALTKGSFVRHSPGASIGGPVYIPHVYNGRNRTFFFFSYETYQGSLTQDVLNPTVPAVPWRTGDFSGTGTVVKDPFDAGTPFPNGVIPTSRLNATALKMQNTYYPQPNFGNLNILQSQNYRQTYAHPFDPSFYMVPRIDHRFNDKWFIYGRATWKTATVNNVVDGALPTLGLRHQDWNNRGLTVASTYTIRPNLLNETRYGFSFNVNNIYAHLMGQQLVQQFGLQGLADNLPNINGFPQVTFSGLGITNVSAAGYLQYNQPGYWVFSQQFQDHVSWFTGRHSFKGGVVIGRMHTQDLSSNQCLFSCLTFSNRFTGFAYADFLLGIPTTSQRDHPALQLDESRITYDFFVTDEFKVSSKLTLSLGLRYEYHPFWTQRNGLQAIFDIGTQQIVVPDNSISKVSPLWPKNYIPIVTASSVGLPSDTLLHNDRNDFAPRIGVAYRPFGNNTVVRAGFGIFYDQTPQLNNPTIGSPFAISEPTFTNPSTNPTVILPFVYPAASAAPTVVNPPGARNPNMVNPYSMQYSATVEHQQWNTGFRVSYIGTNTRKGMYTYDINQPVASLLPYAAKPVAYPYIPGSLSYGTNGAGHQYNSGTFEANHTFRNGLTYQFAYTLARDIGDLEGGQASEDAYNRSRERAVWTDVQTHQVKSFVVYQLPVGKGRRFLSNSNRLLNAVIGGWNLSSLLFINSGNFLTPLWSGTDPTGTRYTSTGTAPVVSLRPNELQNPNLPADQRTVSRWFNVQAFSAPSPGAFGTAPKGAIIGPGNWVLDSGLFKIFNLYERLTFRLEMTGTGVLNHPNWSDPNTTITSVGTVGVITSATGARSMRFGGRLEW